MQHRGECQIVLLGRCLEFHLSNAIMKIGVMQMNKRITTGKCVIVLNYCQAQFKKKKEEISQKVFGRNYYSVFV